LTKKLVGK